jgi:hypothetical protein
VTVQAQEELERILEEHFDGGIEQADRKQFVIRAIFDGEDIIRHLECFGMYQ